MAVMTERPMRMTRGHGGRIPACLRKRARELPSSRNTYVEDGLKLVDEVGELGDSAVVVFAEVSDCESLGMCRSPNGSEEAVAPAECKVVAMVKPALVVERLALAVANVVLAAAELGTVDAAEGRTAGILVVY